MKYTMLGLPLLLTLCFANGCFFFGSGSESEGGPDTATYRATLDKVDPALEALLTELVAVIETTSQLDEQLAADHDSMVGVAVDNLETTTDALVAAVVAYEELESKLQGGDEQRGMITQKLVLLAGAGLMVVGAWAFAQKMKSLSKKMSAQREERDEAMDDMADAKPGAEERYKEAKRKMTTTGGEAVKETTTKIVTDLVLTPLSPTSVTGLVLKDWLGNKLGEGIKIFTATPGCAKEGAPASDCKVTVQRTDAEGRATIPSGKQTVIISTADKARVVVKEVTAKPGEDLELERELIEISEATPEKIKANDEGTYRPGDEPGDPPDASTPSPDASTPAPDTSLPPPAADPPLIDTFPADPVAGMQIAYAIEGPITLSGDSKDLTDVHPPGSALRSVQGVTLGNGRLVARGTAYAEDGGSFKITVTAGAEEAKDGATIAPGGSYEFDVAVLSTDEDGTPSGSVYMHLTNGGDTTGSILINVTTDERH